MSYALINKNNSNVCQFVATEDDCFDVHEDFFWKDIPDEDISEKQPSEFEYEPTTGKIIAKVYAEPTPEENRFHTYPTMEQQLSMIWKDIDAGLMPGKDGSWYKAIKEIKDKYPD
tara:strand:- start:12679 stop:13023 length:345 start_codon:yes stop_codon:yes gene_type:complete